MISGHQTEHSPPRFLSQECTCELGVGKEMECQEGKHGAVEAEAGTPPGLVPAGEARWHCAGGGTCSRHGAPPPQEAASGSRDRQRLITGAEVWSKDVLETAVLSVAAHEDPAGFDSCSSQEPEAENLLAASSGL